MTLAQASEQRTGTIFSQRGTCSIWKTSPHQHRANARSMARGPRRSDPFCHAPGTVQQRLSDCSNGALHLTWNGFEMAANGTEELSDKAGASNLSPIPKSLLPGTFGPEWHGLTPNAAAPLSARSEVRPEGFEPPTLGSEDNFPSSPSASQDKDLRQVQSSLVPSVVPSASCTPEMAELITQLQHLTRIWPRLPASLRQAIVLMVQPWSSDPRATPNTAAGANSSHSWENREGSYDH